MSRATPDTDRPADLGKALDRLLDGYSDPYQFYRQLCDYIVCAFRDTDEQPPAMLRTFQLSAAAQTWLQMQHELRSLLNAVTTNLMVALDSLPESMDEQLTKRQRAVAAAELRECLDDALAAGEACAEISRGSSLLSGTSDRHVLAVLGSTIEMAVRFFHSTHRQVSVDLDVAIDQRDIKLNAPRWQLLQVILNLMENAYEALVGDPEHPTITSDKRLIEISSWATPETAFIRVRDNGPGVPSTVREKVHELFYTTKSHGSGIGLFVCNQLAQSWGGAIEIENAKEPGAAFVIAVPVGPSQTST